MSAHRRSSERKVAGSSIVRLPLARKWAACSHERSASLLLFVLEFPTSATSSHSSFSSLVEVACCSEQSERDAQPRCVSRRNHSRGLVLPDCDGRNHVVPREGTIQSRPRLTETCFSSHSSSEVTPEGAAIRSKAAQDTNTTEIVLLSFVATSPMTPPPIVAIEALHTH